jgi:hypothetical protein
MAYVILVNDDDTLYGSKKERIMQRSKCVDSLIFMVPPIYRNTHDMTNATVMLEYLRPVSRKYETEILELSDERYNDCYLQYKLPFDTKLTSEAGTLELQLTFVYADLDVNGNGIQRVRKTSSTTIEIIPISAWSDIVPDAALSSLDQRLLKLDAQMKALNDYQTMLESNKADNISYNEKDDTLQLTSNGVGIGDKVSVKDMIGDGIPVVELGSGGTTDEDEEPMDDDSVVEF